MKSRKSLLAAALVAAGAFGAAQAAEITLYSQADFHGKALTAQGAIPNVKSAGFNDQTSSIVVTSGRWEVCTHAEFQGHCALLRPGEYPRLDSQFNDRISSIRQVGRDRHAGGLSRDNDPALVLFDQRRLRGEQLGLDGNVRNLKRYDFNDRASSVLVREGTWQVCATANFDGPCRTLGPGAYPNLGPELSDKISSARRVDGHHAQYGRNDPYASRGDWRGERREERRDDRRAMEIALVELFMEPGFQGSRYTASTDVANLAGTPFNDHVVSMRVAEGKWELCSEAGHRGQCIVVGPGRYEHLGEMSNRLSSIRRVE